MKKLAALLSVLLLPPLHARADAIAAGRPVDPEHSFSASVTVGKMTDINGSVQETTRRLFDVTDEPDRQTGQVNYSFEEVGLTESEMMYGLKLEKLWKYATFRLELATLSAEASGSSYRDVFIEVDEVEFQGQTYTHQKLENDVPYEASLDGYYANMGFDLIPFTLNPEGAVEVTPWVRLGVLGVFAEFEVDQGEPQRLQVYENPPETYVVGGHSTSSDGVLSPEVGAGGQIKFNLGRRHERAVALTLQGTYAIFSFHGSTGNLGIGSETDKDVDYDYTSTSLGAQLKVPMTAGTDLLIGASYLQLDVDATSSAKDRSYEETVERREKFDKDITFGLTMITGYIGIRW